MHTAAVRDATADIVGPQPIPIRVFFGDERLRAFSVDAAGNSPGPGVQAVTLATERALNELAAGGRVAVLRAAQNIGREFPFLLNLACQSPPGKFLERLPMLAAAAGQPGPAPADLQALEMLKQATDQAFALGPTAIIRAALAYLAAPDPANGHDHPCGTLVSLVNQLATNAGNNPRLAAGPAPLRGLADLEAAGIELWWVKEGSATIVFQVLVPLAEGQPPVRFALNVAKDLSLAADELRQIWAEFVELYRIDPAFVMQPLRSGEATISTWRGALAVPLLAAEWFDGHELHVYEDGPQLYVWQDQRMGRSHPIPMEVSDRIWETMLRICARYTRVTARGLRPVWAHINAGDFIFRERPGGEWDVLLIWIRPPPLPDLPDEAGIVTALLYGTRAFGADRDTTVWWDQPARALAALDEGLRQAGLASDRVRELVQRALEGAFSSDAGPPAGMPYLPAVAPDEEEKLRGVFQRARGALEDYLRSPAD
ncbi:MAG: hypothetical protein ABI661_04670 [Gammaproteobacteria bacterium]